MRNIVKGLALAALLLVAGCNRVEVYTTRTRFVCSDVVVKYGRLYCLYDHSEKVTSVDTTTVLKVRRRGL
jgi:hypothetical protein